MWQPFWRVSLTESLYSSSSFTLTYSPSLSLFLFLVTRLSSLIRSFSLRSEFHIPAVDDEHILASYTFIHNHQSTPFTTHHVHLTSQRYHARCAIVSASTLRSCDAYSPSFQLRSRVRVLNLRPSSLNELISEDLVCRLKTRDIQIIFKDWETDKGGFKIKWLDDVNALVVFADATVGEFRISNYPFSRVHGMRGHGKPDR